MISHHASAILMCEKASLQNPEIKEPCEQIISSQQAEIEQMKNLLNETTTESFSPILTAAIIILILIILTAFSIYLRNTKEKNRKLFIQNNQAPKNHPENTHKPKPTTQNHNKNQSNQPKTTPIN
jgi:hypothetical protein